MGNDKEGTTAMSDRPIRLTNEMKLAAAMETAKDVKRDCFDFRDEPIEELAEQIASQARSQYMDGYELAKALDDRCGWDVDTVMVGALDNWSSNATRVLNEAQKAWRDATNPQPAFKVGDRVKLKGGEAGEVTDADYQYGVAQYLVKIDGEQGNGKRIVNYEDATVDSSASPSPPAPAGRHPSLERRAQ